MRPRASVEGSPRRLLETPTHRATCRSPYRRTEVVLRALRSSWVILDYGRLPALGLADPGLFLAPKPRTERTRVAPPPAPMLTLASPCVVQTSVRRVRERRRF